MAATQAFPVDAFNFDKLIDHQQFRGDCTLFPDSDFNYFPVHQNQITRSSDDQPLRSVSGPSAAAMRHFAIDPTLTDSEWSEVSDTGRATGNLDLCETNESISDFETSEAQTPEPAPIACDSSHWAKAHFVHNPHMPSSADFPFSTDISFQNPTSFNDTPFTFESPNTVSPPPGTHLEDYHISQCSWPEPTSVLKGNGTASDTSIPSKHFIDCPTSHPYYCSGMPSQEDFTKNQEHDTPSCLGAHNPGAYQQEMGRLSKKRERHAPIKAFLRSREAGGHVTPMLAPEANMYTDFCYEADASDCSNPRSIKPRPAKRARQTRQADYPEEVETAYQRQGQVYKSDDGSYKSFSRLEIQGRRHKHPGRKITVPQTPEVIARNAARRERYRAQLSENRRQVYDRERPANVTIAEAL